MTPICWIVGPEKENNEIGKLTIKYMNYLTNDRSTEL